MIGFLRRALSVALTPPTRPALPYPTDNDLAAALGLQRVETYTDPAWNDFQAATTAELEAARAKHGRTREIEAKRSRIVHEALRRAG